MGRKSRIFQSMNSPEYVFFERYVMMAEKSSYSLVGSFV